MSKEYSGQDKHPGRLGDCETTSTIQETIGRAFENQCARENLRERVVSRAVRCRNEANQLARLNRLAELMEKHPEVVEIIDLLQGLNLF